MPWLWPICARPGGGEVTWQWGRPARSRSVLARAGGRTLGRQHALVVAGLRTPGRGRSYLAVGTPRQRPVRACRGGREDTRQAPHPSSDRSARAGAGEKIPGNGDAPAAAPLCVPGREGGHQAGSMPRLWPVCARRGGGGATWRLWRPGSGRSVLAGAGGRTLGRLHARAVTPLRAPGLGRNYLAVGTPRPQPLFACQGGREDTR